MIKQISNLCKSIGIDNHIWIYNWNSDTMQFYCIPQKIKDVNDNEFGSANNNKNRISEPIAVNLSPEFKQKYNHLVIITKNVHMFKKRISGLRSIFLDLRVIVHDKPLGGHLIMRKLTPKQILNGDNKGDAVFVYCAKAEELFFFLRINYYYYHIEAMGNFQNSIQCFFNHKRRIDNNFESRGLFKIIANKDNEDAIEFISSSVDDQHFPPYKITAFDIETAQLDNKFPTGDTIYDRVCSVAFQTVTVEKVSEPTNYKDEENIILIYAGNINIIDEDIENALIIHCATEKELLIKCLHYIARPDAMFITGWNIINFDYKILLKRLMFHDIIPEYLNRKKLYGLCSLRDRGCDIAPPWKLSIDTMASRKRFFPRHLPVNPPSNSIDVTAKVLLGGSDDAGKIIINITRINYIYNLIENNKNNNIDIMEIKNYLKELIIYNLKDVELVTKLNGILQIIQTLVPLSLLADLNPGDCIHYNTTKIGVTYMKNQFQSVILAPIDYNLIYNSNNNAGLMLLSKNNNEEEEEEEDNKIRGKKGTYKGATVLEPKIGVHKSDSTTLIGSVDFASLYPNIMLSYGIIRGYVTRISKRKYKKEWNEFFTTLHTPDDSKNVYLSCKKNIEECPISYLCKRLIEKRKLNRRTAPTVANALKVLVNSLYGICGVQGSPLYDQIAATMITAYGRHHLMRAKMYFEETFTGLTVLYGDTDSLFIKCSSGGNDHGVTLQQMTDRYNDYLAGDCGLKSIQLSVDGIYESIIFIRKKLYMAKMTSNHRYKISGFPQRLEPRIFNLMLRSLYTILDLSTTSTNLERDTRQFYSKLFEDSINKIADPSYSIKVNPLHSYKSKTNKHYYVGTLYEKYHATPILDTIYIPIYELIPIVRDVGKKCLRICLKDTFDRNLHTLNKSAFLTETFCKTFDPILEVIAGGSENIASASLKFLCEQYMEKLQCESLLMYVNGGFSIFDFSKCKFNCHNIKISLLDAWPKFYKEFIFNNNMRSVSKKISWIKEEEEEEEEEEEDRKKDGEDDEDKGNRNENDKKLRKRNIFLSINILSCNNINNNNNNNNNISIATLSCGIEKTNLKQIQFKNVNELKFFLNNFLKYNNNNSNNMIKKVYIKIKNTFDVYRDILNFFAFIYNKNFTQFELDNLNNNKYLIVLPFIAIKSDNYGNNDNNNNNNNNNYIFTYF